MSLTDALIGFIIGLATGAIATYKLIERTIEIYNKLDRIAKGGPK